MESQQFASTINKLLDVCKKYNHPITISDIKALMPNLKKEVSKHISDTTPFETAKIIEKRDFSNLIVVPKDINPFLHDLVSINTLGYLIYSYILNKKI